MTPETDLAFASCEALVRRADPDRYLSALFAPSDRRPLLYSLYAFNHELAHISEAVREPMMGEIRLQWWREGIESARAQRPRAHDILRTLAVVFEATELPRCLFDGMIDARAFDFSGKAFPHKAARDAYLDSTSGNLMRLAGRILDTGDTHDDFAREAGIAYGLAGLLRSQAFHAARTKVMIANPAEATEDARAHLTRARQLVRPGTALPAFLPAALVPIYLRNPARDVPVHRKQIAMLGAALRGRP